MVETAVQRRCRGAVQRRVERRVERRVQRRCPGAELSAPVDEVRTASMKSELALSLGANVQWRGTGAWPPLAAADPAGRATATAPGARCSCAMRAERAQMRGEKLGPEPRAASRRAMARDRQYAARASRPSAAAARCAPRAPLVGGDSSPHLPASPRSRAQLHLPASPCSRARSWARTSELPRVLGGLATHELGSGTAASAAAMAAAAVAAAEAVAGAPAGSAAAAEKGEEGHEGQEA